MLVCQEWKRKEPVISGFSYFYFFFVEGMKKKKVKEVQKSVEVVKKDISITGITKSITLEFGLNRMMEENTCG